VGRAPADVAGAFLAAGARVIQLRCKTMASGAFLALAQRVLEDVNAAGAALIINDRADVAALAGAHGLHVGQEDLRPEDARSIIGEAVLGVSTHTKEQWDAAAQSPITYLAIGPAFATGTKETGYSAVGLEVIGLAARATAAHGLPIVAIGGITMENAVSVIDAGAASVAVISGLVSGDPESRCRAFLRLLQ